MVVGCSLSRHREITEITERDIALFNTVISSTQVIFSKFSPSTAGSHFQRICGEKLKLLHFLKNWPLSVRCPLIIQARTSGRNFAEFDQRAGVEKVLDHGTIGSRKFLSSLKKHGSP